MEQSRGNRNKAVEHRPDVTAMAAQTVNKRPGVDLLLLILKPVYLP